MKKLVQKSWVRTQKILMGLSLLTSIMLLPHEASAQGDLRSKVTPKVTFTVLEDGV